MLKRRKAASPKKKKNRDMVHEQAQIAVQRLEELRQAEEKNLAPPSVCLVNEAFATHKVVETLVRGHGLQLRTADGLPVSFLLPKEKVSFLLVGHDDRFSGGPMGSADHQVYLSITQGAMFERARKTLMAVKEKKTSSRIIMLVMSNLELYKHLCIEAISLQGAVSILPCYNPEEAVSHILNISKMTESVISSYESAVRSFESHQSVTNQISSQIPEFPIKSNLILNASDLNDLLAGRTSDAICQEHFAWSVKTARAVHNSLRNDSLEP